MDRHKVSIFALVGFGEGMEKDIARVQRIAELGAYPFPMRYVPLDSLEKRPPAKGWDNPIQISQLMRFYNQPRIWTSSQSHDGFERWMKNIKPERVGHEGQIPMSLTTPLKWVDP